MNQEKYTPNQIIDYLFELFPDAKCELEHQSTFQLLVAVVLSAQTTDLMVNKVTPKLFEKYPTPEKMALATPKQLYPYIQSIGLYKNKAKMLVELSNQLLNNFNGIVPNKRKQLMQLSGVGQKTANVVLSVAFDVPAIAVDTHVNRVSKRLKLAKVDDSLEMVEKKLKRKINREKWNLAHHLFIFFGRYFCKAQNPACDQCLLIKQCAKEKLKKYNERHKSNKTTKRKITGN